MKLRLLISLLAAFLPCQGYELETGFGIVADRMPYKGYGIEWSYFPIIDFENDYLYVRDFGMGVKFLTLRDRTQEPCFVLSAFSAYDYFKFSRNKTSDEQLKKLDNRRESVFTGVKWDGVTPVGLFSSSAGLDLSGNSQGFLGDISYHLPIEVGSLEFIPHFGLRLAGRRYNYYYFGVNMYESERSGLPDYTPGSALTPFTGVTIYLTISEQWEVVGGVEIMFLPGRIKNSPMTGRSSSHSLFLGVNYLF